MGHALGLTRDRILAFRQRTGSLGERLPGGRGSLRRAAWAGLQDSMPRAALLSLHARVDGVAPDALDDPSLVQLWGPRFSAYVVAAEDVAVFTRGRLPVSGAKRERADTTAERVAAVLPRGERKPYGEVGRALGVDPNMLRYAAPTGTVLLRWDGARQPLIWTVPAPDVDDGEARRELARRYLHVFGPSTAAVFAQWAGVHERAAGATFDALVGELAPVTTPIGDAWILAGDEDAFRRGPAEVSGARLLPSGDAYHLRWGAERELLVPDPDHRELLWTSRVWPGALLVDGEIVGTWRRSQHRITVAPWRPLPRRARDAVETAARSLPLPSLDRELEVSWD
ncbi:MAG: winged helix DNA-binding domain-containing protein [Actinobacteria bacterium]|nr:winged helix DNA-binding domain-containing protein [Actinomycetota bacterium]